MDAHDLAAARVGQIAVRVHDLERAVAFYRDTLGLPFVFQFPGLAFFKAGEVRLMLSRPEQKEFDHPSSIIYFSVPDVAATHLTLEARGVEFKEQPRVVHRTDAMELWMGAFADSEGNTLAIMCERPIDQT